MVSPTLFCCYPGLKKNFSDDVISYQHVRLPQQHYSYVRFNQKMSLVAPLFNPLNPRSGCHQISPYSIIPELNIKFMRIKEMITI